MLTSIPASQELNFIFCVLSRFFGLEFGSGVFSKKPQLLGTKGLMSKKLDSLYTPGRRGKKWLKVKTVLETLNLVIIAAEYGYGRRKGWLSDYYLAARNPETGEFLDLGKTFKGLTDAEIIEMTKQFEIFRN